MAIGWREVVIHFMRQIASFWRLGVDSMASSIGCGAGEKDCRQDARDKRFLFHQPCLFFSSTALDSETTPYR